MGAARRETVVTRVGRPSDSSNEPVLLRAAHTGSRRGQAVMEGIAILLRSDNRRPAGHRRALLTRRTPGLRPDDRVRLPPRSGADRAPGQLAPAPRHPPVRT